MTSAKIFDTAIDELALLRFFPPDPGARAALIGLLARMVGNCPLYGTNPAQRLHWLTQAMLTHYNEWPGPETLRAVYCTRFKPADGIERDLTSGSLAEEIERRAIEGHADMKILPEPARKLLRETTGGLQ